MAALRAFTYDTPRAKTLCRIGKLFSVSDRLLEAEYWYKAALICTEKQTLGFEESDYRNFIPAMQLCVICDRLGKIEQAEYYNDLAGKYRPNSPAYIYNKNYFDNIKRG